MPYLWGGDDPHGWDCSGLVQEILTSVGAWPRGTDLTADGMMRYFEERDCLIDEEEEIDAGDIVFFCTDEGRAVHVEFVVSVGEEGEIYCLGASGGGSTTTDEESAWRQNAYVKVRPQDTTHPTKTRVWVDPFGVGVMLSKNGTEG